MRLSYRLSSRLWAPSLQEGELNSLAEVVSGAELCETTSCPGLLLLLVPLHGLTSKGQNTPPETALRGDSLLVKTLLYFFTTH
jgi:hypothetical protein